MKAKKISTLVSALVLVALIFGLGVGSGPAGSQELDESTEEPEFAPHRILVKTEEGAPKDTVGELNRENDARTKDKLSEIDVSVVQLPEDLPAEAAAKRYEASPDVEYAEPDYKLYPSQTSRTPKDPGYRKLYGLNNTRQTGGKSDADIDSPEAWRSTTGKADTVVAVIDSGVDIKHPDLRDNIWTNPDEVPNNNKDDDGNGYVDDVHGWDFRNDNKSVYDGPSDDHGTHVAGTIAAEGNNGIGVTGVNWRASIMPLKFIGRESGYTSDAAEALDYAVSEGVKISNNSYGCIGCKSTPLLDAVGSANEAGHVFVAAAGNDGKNTDYAHNEHYPSGIDKPNVVSVAATDHSDTLAGFSNRGAASVDVAAPGVSIRSTVPGNSYGNYSGTSMAAPHVAGVAALTKSRFPGISGAGIKKRILDSADRKTGLKNKMVSGGRLNAARALGLNPPPPNRAPIITRLRPSPGSKTKLRRPRIKAKVLDRETNLAKKHIKLYLNGDRKSFSYYRSRNNLTFRPKKKLSTGRTYRVKIVARDAQGLVKKRSWRFRIVR